MANLRFELIGESSRPLFKLTQTDPVVQREGFRAINAIHSVEGEINLWNFMFDNSFE